MSASTGKYATQLQLVGAQIDTDFAAATGQAATIAAQLSSAQSALAAAQAIDQADAVQIAALQLQITTLEAQLAAATAPPVAVVPPPTPPPPSGIVFVDNDFSASVIAPLTVDGRPAPGSQLIVAAPDGSGRKCLQFASPPSGTDNYIYYRFANNAALTTNHPGGIFARFEHAFDAPTLAALAASSGGQFKSMLSRYLDWNSTPGAVNNAGPDGLMLGTGPAFYGEGGSVPSQLVAVDDSNTSTIPQSATGAIFEPNVFQRIKYCCGAIPSRRSQPRQAVRKNFATSLYELKVDYKNANLFRDSDGTYDHLYLMLGIPYSSLAGTAFLTRVKIADFDIVD